MGAELVPIVNFRSSSGQHHSELRDTSFDTFWTDTRNDAWIEIDLGSKRRYNLLQIVFGSGLDRRYHFSVWKEDAPDYPAERIFDGHSKRSAQLTSYDLKDSESQFIRIVIHENDSAQSTKAQVSYIEVLHESAQHDLIKKSKQSETDSKEEKLEEGAPLIGGDSLNALVFGPSTADVNSTVILDGTGSTGNIRNYTFKQKEGVPVRNMQKLNDIGSKISFIAPPIKCELKIKLIVTDSDNKKDRDYHVMKVVASPPPPVSMRKQPAVGTESPSTKKSLGK